MPEPVGSTYVTGGIFAEADRNVKINTEEHDPF